MRPTEYLKSVGMEIRVARTRQGLSTGELADKAIVCRDGLNNIELGKKDVRLSTLKRITDALGISIKDVL